jgi:hypothetical protein
VQFARLVRRPAREVLGVAVPRRGADGIGPHTEGAAPVVGAVPPGLVLLGTLRVEGRAGGRPRAAGRLLAALVDRCGRRGVLQLDGDADVAAELFRQRLGEHPPHPRLEHRLRELVGCGEHRGVLDQAERPGQVEHRVLLWGQAGSQPLTDLVPDRRQVQRGIGHAARSSRSASSPGAPGHSCVHRQILPLWIRARWRSTPLSTGCARSWGSCTGSVPNGRSPHLCRSAAVPSGRSGSSAVGRPTESAHTP